MHRLSRYNEGNVYCVITVALVWSSSSSFRSASAKGKGSTWLPPISTSSANCGLKKRHNSQTTPISSPSRIASSSHPSSQTEIQFRTRNLQTNLKTQAFHCIQRSRQAAHYRYRTPMKNLHPLLRDPKQFHCLQNADCSTESVRTCYSYGSAIMSYRSTR